MRRESIRSRMCGFLAWRRRFRGGIPAVPVFFLFFSFLDYSSFLRGKSRLPETEDFLVRGLVTIGVQGRLSHGRR